MENNIEFKKLIEYKHDVKEATIKSYLTVYKRIIESTLFIYEINHTSQQNCINYIELITDKISSLLNMLNVIIIIKQAYKKDIAVLLKQRDKYNDMAIKQREETNTNLKEILPTKDELLLCLDNYFSDGLFVQYIINYLLINLNTRNADLYIDIVDNSIPYKKLKKDTNYLIIRSKDIQYIRNIYKTVDSYNVKVDIIKDKKFIYAVKQIGLKSLVLDKHNNKIDLLNIGAYIKRLSAFNLGEINIFKSVVKDSSISSLSKLSQNRGTKINTILCNYDVN